MDYQVKAPADELTIAVSSADELTGLQGFLHAHGFTLADTEAQSADPERGAGALRELRAILAEKGPGGLRQLLTASINGLRGLERPKNGKP